MVNQEKRFQELKHEHEGKGKGKGKVVPVL
jgi:hypothetical protein